MDEQLLKTFEQSAENVKIIIENKKPDDETLLFLYGHYKQATIGDCNTSEPSFWYVKDRSKYHAWKSLTGMEKNKAMELYINKVNELSKK